MARTQLGQTRVVGRASPPHEHGSRIVVSRRGEEERKVPRHVEETCRQRQLLAADPSRQALPVPAGEHVLERPLDAGTQLEPACEPLRNLAHRRERLAGSRRIGERRLDQPLANLRRASRTHVGAVEGEHLRRVGRIDQEEGCPVLDVLAEEERRLVPVRGAAGGVEERDVVRVGDFRRRRSRELAETDGQHRASQGVLERLPGAEIGRQRDRPDDLRCPDRVLTRRGARSVCVVIPGRHAVIG